MRRRRWRSPAALLVLLLGLFACRDMPSSDAVCERSCLRLSTCGFLPSALAPLLDPNDDPLDACMERCVESASTLVDEIDDCTAVVRPQTSTQWCSANDKQASPCEQAQTCLQRLVADGVPISGEIDVRLEARDGSSRAHPPQTQPSKLRCGAGEPSADAETAPAGSMLCETFGLDAIEYFVIQGGDRSAKRFPCAAGFERGADFPKLKPGQVIAGLQLEGPIPVQVEQPDGTKTTETATGCVSYYATTSLLHAGTGVKLAIYVPRNKPALDQKICFEEPAPDSTGDR